MSHRYPFDNLKDKHNYHRELHGIWMFKDSDGNWQPFWDDRHMANTVNDPSRSWEIMFFTQVPDMAMPAGVL